MQVKAQVINPNYQEAKVEVKAKFFDEYDEAFYLKQLDEDIKNTYRLGLLQIQKMLFSM